MSAIKIQQFGGQLPAWDDALLPATQAALSQNCYLFSGALTGWRAPKLLRTLTNPNAKIAYRVPTVTRAQASATLTFSSQVNDGDTVKIGEEIYTFRNTLVAAYDVKRGANLAASITALLAAVNIGINVATDNANVGVLFATGTETNPAVSQIAGDNTATATTLTVKAPDFGAAFNTTVVTESTAGVRMSWSASTFTGGTNSTFDSSITGPATWLEFEDHETDMVRSPVVDDKFNRVYFASPSQPPKYNTYDRVVAGAVPWLLGLNPPGCPPGVTVTGGTDTAQLGFPTSTTSDVQSPGANTINLLKVTPLGAMELADIAFVPAETNATVNYTGVVYEDNAGAPGALLNSTLGGVGTTSETQITLIFVNPSTLAAGTPYWIGVMMDQTLSLQKADAVGTAGYTGVTTYSNGPPAHAPAMVSGKPDWQIWGDASTAALLETRAYVYTWVTAYGEESAPSPPTVVTGWNNGTWTIDLFTPPPDDMGVLRNITKKRLYRTISAVGGQTDYFLVTPLVPTGSVAEVDAGDLGINVAQYVDIVLDSVIANNTILPSATWFPPPEGLEGIAQMPNGMNVGFKGNEIWFAEPYRPHAWPPQYVITTEFPIVGLGVVGHSVVAATSATPYIATGINPGSMSLSKILIPEPCTSRGSIVSTLSAVYYTSPNGLIAINGYGVGSNITEAWITRDKWRTLTPPFGTHAISLASCYFAFGIVENGDNTYAKTGFTIELVNDSNSFTIWPQPGGHRIGFNNLTAPGSLDIFNVLNDPWTGIGMLIQNGALYYYDFSDAAPTITPYKWRSKVYQQPSKKSFEAMKCFFSVPPGTPAQGTRNQSPTNDASWNTLASNQYGIIRVYADDVLVTAREIVSSGELLRVLSGFKAERWQWEIEGRIQISNLQVATNVRELGGI
jgi:hypothetical protein